MLVLLGIFCGLVVAWLVLWFVWMPSYRPSLREGESYGVDVSHHQGVVAWERVAKDNISFAYIKATEGGDHVDTQFAANWSGAKSAGLRRSAYHFFTFCRPGLEQARNFLKIVPSDAELPPVVDVEFGGNCSKRPSRADFVRELKAFVSTVEAERGDKVVIYSIDSAGMKYWTGRGGIVTPDDPIETIEAVARAYGPRWLVIEKGDAATALAPILRGETRPSWIGPPAFIVPAADGGLPVLVLYPVCTETGDDRCSDTPVLAGR